MEEIIRVAFANMLVEELASGDLWNFARKERIHTQLTIWRSMLKPFLAVLAYAEEKQITDQATKCWLYELRGLMYDMEDVLDEFMFEDLRRQGMVRKLIFKTKGVRKLSFKMDEITARLQALFNQTMVFGSKIIDEKHGIRFNTPFDDSCFCVDFFNATSAEGEPLIGSARLPVRDLVLGERAVRKKLVVTCPSGRPIGEVTVMLAVRRVENPLPPEKTVTVVYEERAVDDFDEDDLT